MNIQQFQYVLAVAELKHFEQAAEKCCVTQSTLSTMIGKFENEIGIKIFDRKSKPVSITKEGVELIHQLQITVKEIKTFENKVQELKGELQGDLQIGVIPTIAPYLLPIFLKDFAQQFPNVRMTVQEMTTAEIQKSLKNRSLDIGIAAVPLEDENLMELHLYNESFMIFDYQSYTANQAKITIDDIDFSHLLLLEEGHCFRNQVQQICNLSKTKSENVMNFEFRAGSLDSLIRFTKSYKGVTLLPQMATKELSTSEKKHLREFVDPVPMRSVGLVVHKHFIKKHLLEKLQTIIKSAVLKRFMPNESEGEIINPLH